MSTALIEPPKRSARRPLPARPDAPTAPLLDNGYRLTQPDFHRRYLQLPKVKQAELIEGTVFMGSPLSFAHGRATNHVLTWLGLYEAETPGVESADNATLILDLENEYQPDALLRLDQKHGGKSWLEAGYLHGAPELIVEVALTSVTQDLGNKLKVYRRHGVQEYLVWQLSEQKLDWFALRDAEYVPLLPGPRGSLRSGAFPGLWLDAEALLAGDLKAVLRHLQKGMDGSEHAAFAKTLTGKRATPHPEC